MSALTFVSNMNALAQKAKQIYKPDADGYYRVPLGALNVTNSAGEFYIINEKVKALFNASSSLISRLSDGALKAEVGHPKPTPGMTKEDYIRRIIEIDEKNVCGHFRKITVSDKPTKVSFQREPIYQIFGEVKPQGAFGEALKSDLDNPYSNTAFSIRSLTKNTVIAGITRKELIHVVTFDWVNRPGIATANKSSMASMEESMLTINMEDIAGMMNVIETMYDIATESEKSALHEIKNALSECKTGDCPYNGW